MEVALITAILIVVVAGSAWFLQRRSEERFLKAEKIYESYDLPDASK